MESLFLHMIHDDEDKDKDQRYVAAGWTFCLVKWSTK